MLISNRWQSNIRYICELRWTFANGKTFKRLEELIDLNKCKTPKSANKRHFDATFIHWSCTLAACQVTCSQVTESRFCSNQKSKGQHCKYSWVFYYCICNLGFKLWLRHFWNFITGLPVANLSYHPFSVFFLFSPLENEILRKVYQIWISHGSKFAIAT